MNLLGKSQIVFVARYMGVSELTMVVVIFRPSSFHLLQVLLIMVAWVLAMGLLMMESAHRPLVQVLLVFQVPPEQEDYRK